MNVIIHQGRRMINHVTTYKGIQLLAFLNLLQCIRNNTAILSQFTVLIFILCSPITLFRIANKILMLVVYQLNLQDTQNFLPKTYDAQLVMKITSQ